MSIKCTCPQCGASLRVLDSYAGSRRECPKCGVEFDVPATHPASQEGTSTSSEKPTELDQPSWETDLLNHAVEYLLTQSSATTSRRRDWLILIVSLALSVAAGLYFVSFQTVLFVLGIILFHELGHFAAMRFFDYQNVRIFFIPFLGAATAGRRSNIAGYKEAIVLLMGPAPGILFGIACVAAYLQTGQIVWFELAGLPIVINVFNLLPLLPLDGGQLVLLTIFSRGRNLEAAYRYGTAIGLGVLGWWLSWWILIGLAVFMLIGVRWELTISRIANRLRHNRELKPLLDASDVSDDAAKIITQEVFTSVHHDNSPKLIAGVARRIWDRLHIHPPGGLATAAVLLVHLALFAVSPFAIWILLFQPAVRVVTKSEADGTIRRVEETYRTGTLRRVTEVSDENLYHGEETLYQPVFGGGRVVAQRGTWRHGKWHGVWKLYHPFADAPHGVIVFDRGRFVEYRLGMNDGRWITETLADQSEMFRKWHAEHQRLPPLGPDAGRVDRSPLDYPNPDSLPFGRHDPDAPNVE